MFVVNKTAEQVSVISTSTNSVAGSIAVPGTPGSFGQFFGPSGPPALEVLAAAVLPTSRSVVVGNSATFAATVLNTSATNVNNCQFALPRAFPTGLSLLYQTLSPSGQLTGQPNQPVSIAANSGQGFLLAFQSSSPVNSISQPLVISAWQRHLSGARRGWPRCARSVVLDNAGARRGRACGDDKQ